MSFSTNINLSGAWTTTLPSSLAYFRCKDNPFLTFIPTIPSNVTYLDIAHNYLPATVLDSTCADLVTNGLSNGYLDIRMNQALLPSTYPRITTLLSRGWTVNYV
jgi:hypothetical protein